MKIAMCKCKVKASKRAKKLLKKYGSRRAAIKRGNFGKKARFGRAGHSSWWD